MKAGGRGREGKDAKKGSKVFFMVLLVFMIRFLKAEHIKNAG